MLEIKDKYQKKKSKKAVKASIKPKKGPVRLTKLQREADRLMSLYVRINASDAEGMCACYTCDHQAHYSKMQNGHYISRYYKSRRYDLRQTRVQCSMCNMWKNGDIPGFRMKLVKELGGDVVSEIETGYKDIIKMTPEFYYEKIEQFSFLLEGLGISPKTGKKRDTI